MERAAAFFAEEAKQSWHHYTTANNAEKYLARISPTHFVNPEKNSSSNNNAEDLTVSVEEVGLVATSDPPDLYVIEEWEVISMADVSQALGGERSEDGGVVLSCDEKTQAECLVRELEGQMRGVAACSALGKYLTAVSNQDEAQKVMLGTGEEGGVVVRKDSERDVGVALGVNKGEKEGVVMRIGDSDSGVAMGKGTGSFFKREGGSEEDMEGRNEDVDSGSAVVREEAGRDEGVAMGKDIGGEGKLFKREGSSAEGLTLGEGVDSRSAVMTSDGGPDLRDEGVALGVETGEEEGVVRREGAGKEDGFVTGKDTDDGGVILKDGIGEEVLLSDTGEEGLVSNDEGGVILEDDTRIGVVILEASMKEQCTFSTEQPRVSDVRSGLPEPIPIQACDACTNTYVPSEERPPLPVSVNHASSQTTLGWEDLSRAPCEERGTSPQPPLVLVSHTRSSQTTLSCEDLLARAQVMKELEMLKVELHVAQSNLNTETSQRQVSEELVKIVQTDLNSLTERNMSEVMAKVMVENHLTDVKAELSHTSRQLKEGVERIQELEDILKGTTLMVRKLEEQNATTLINRGGIDYMLQARLADGRAKEAEQKLQVLQAELLQSQGEVRMLLDRVGESSRDRAEMVSSRVHTQLMAIADEKVVASERRAQIMEREILELRNRLTHYEKDQPPTLHRPGYGQSGFSGLTSSGLTGLSSYGLSGSSVLGGVGGLGSGLTGLGSGLMGLGGGLTGLSGPTGFVGSGLTGFGGGLMGAGSSYSPYSPYSTHPSSTLSSGLGSYALQPPSLQEQYNLHTSPTTLSSATPPTSTSSSFSPSSLGVESRSHDFKLKSHDEKVTPHDKVVLTTPAPGINGGGADAEVNGFTLPSFDAPPADKMGGHVPSPSRDVAGSHGDSDSSSWSSSDEEEGEMKPSTHSSLIAEWEWRAMKQDTPTSSNVESTSSVAGISRKPRPPVAPKPTAWQVSIEPPSSFEEPIRSTTLPHAPFRKPRGPTNRRVPRRWHQFPFPFN